MTGRVGGGGGVKGGARGALHSGSGAPMVEVGTRATEKIAALVELIPQQEIPVKHSE